MSDINYTILSKEDEDNINHMTKIIILRGLVNPDCDWWEQSDKLTDKSGVNKFNELLNKYY